MAGHRLAAFSLSVLLVSMTPLVNGATSDCGIGSDAGNTQDAATPLAPPVAQCAGRVGPGDHDWYSFAGRADGVVFVRLDIGDVGNGASMCVIPPDPHALPQCGSVSVTFHVAAAAGTWFLHLHNGADVADYRLTVSLMTDVREGDLLLGHPATTRSPHGVNGLVGPTAPSGVDGSWVLLDPPPVANETLSVGFAPQQFWSANGYQARFFDGDERELPDAGCTGPSAYQFCSVPLQAVWVLVSNPFSVPGHWILEFHR